MTTPHTHRGLASLLAAGAVVMGMAVPSYAGVNHTGIDHLTAHLPTDSGTPPTSDEISDGSAAIPVFLLPHTRVPRPIGGSLCDDEGQESVRSSVTYTCTRTDDGVLMWAPDAATVVIGERCVIRGEQAALSDEGGKSRLVACVRGDAALTWQPASRMCLSAVAARTKVAAELVPLREQLEMLTQPESVRGSSVVSTSRHMAPLRRSVATMTTLVDKLTLSARSACGR